MEKSIPETAKKPSKKTSSEGFAVIKTGGKQYKVSTGDILKIEKLNDTAKIGDSVTFDQVLLTDNGSDTVLGAPLVSGSKVMAEIVEIGRSPKVIVARYMQKNRSGFKKNSHRQPFFKVKINSIA
jgi:large subunit ribosomal protein L21